jgi:hypothetical protein
MEEQRGVLGAMRQRRLQNKTAAAAATAEEEVEDGQAEDEDGSWGDESDGGDYH